MFKEEMWLLSPILAALALGGLIVAGIERKAADKFVLSMTLVHLVVFAFYNFHAYYFLPLAPMAALAVGRLATKVLRTPRRLALAGCIVAVLMVPLVVSTLAYKRYSFTRVDKVPELLSERGYDLQRTTLAVEETLNGMYGPVAEYYATRAGATTVVFSPPASASIPPGTRPAVLSVRLIGANLNVREIAPLPRRVVSPVFFGYAFRQRAGVPYNFMVLEWPTVSKVGPWWRFGLLQEQVPAKAEILYEFTS